MFKTRKVIAEILSIAGAIRQQCTSKLLFPEGIGRGLNLIQARVSFDQPHCDSRRNQVKSFKSPLARAFVESFNGNLLPGRAHWFVALAREVRATLIIRLVQKIVQPTGIDHMHRQCLQDALVLTRGQS